MVLKFDDVAIVGYRTTSMEMGATFGDATTGDSTNQWEESIPLQKNMRCSVSGLYDPDADEGVSEAITKLKAGTKFTLGSFFGTESGDKYEEADAYIEKVACEGDYSDLQSYDLDIRVTGEPETKTVT